MSATNPMFAAGALAAAAATMLLLDRLFDAGPISERRFRSLEGLRGYLALLVFVHHAAIWYFYLRSGAWTLPPSRLYIHFGQSSVALFFMITGVLFWSKVMEARHRPVDWLRLYTSRALRLLPLYALAVGLLWVYAIAGSGFELHVGLRTAVKTTVQWLSFTILGMPALNAFPETTYAIAGAVWSLPYEWWFYGLLPIAALLFRPRQPWLLVAASLALTAVGARWALSPFGRGITASFLGGIAAAYAVRYPRLCAAARSTAAAGVALLALAIATRSDTAFQWSALVPLTVAFVIVACGNTLFGILEWRVSKLLGEMGYSLYLLHGFVLYAAFRWAVGDRAAALTVAGHWAIVLACAPVLVTFCYVTFTAIESPAMSSTNRAAAFVRRRLPPAAPVVTVR